VTSSAVEENKDGMNAFMSTDNLLLSAVAQKLFSVSIFGIKASR
jgi:hypothetical protein